MELILLFYITGVSQWRCMTSQTFVASLSPIKEKTTNEKTREKWTLLLLGFLKLVK